MRAKRGFSSRSPLAIRNTYLAGITRVPLMLDELDVPTVAAVDSPAIEASMDLACICDIRIASDAASCASSFVKISIVPGDGGTWLLSKTVGPAKAPELMLHGKTIAADETQRIGLLSRVVSAAELISFTTSLKLSSAFQALARCTEDHAEAVDTFIEKRDPMFLKR